MQNSVELKDYISVVWIEQNTESLTEQLSSCLNVSPDEEPMGILCLGRDFNSATKIDLSNINEFFDLLEGWNKESRNVFSFDLSQLVNKDIEFEYKEEIFSGILAFFVKNSNYEVKTIFIESVEILTEPFMNILREFMKSELTEKVGVVFFDTYKRIYNHDFVPKFELLYRDVDKVVLKGFEGLKHEPIKLKDKLEPGIYKQLKSSGTDTLFETQWLKS